jgi:transposase
MFCVIGGARMGKIGEAGVRRRAEFYYQQLDALRTVRQEVRRELLAEGKKHKAWKQLCQIPSIGPIRAAVLLGILQTPHRFRTKRQLWTYSGLGIETHSSADHRSVNGQLERAKKQIFIRGLNRNCNHDLKNLFKGAATMASSKPGPFQEFYTALLDLPVSFDTSTAGVANASRISRARIGFLSKF